MRLAGKTGLIIGVARGIGRAFAVSNPYGGMGSVEDLKGNAILLASDEANYVVCQSYNVDGGPWTS